MNQVEEIVRVALGLGLESRDINVLQMGLRMRVQGRQLSVSLSQRNEPSARPQ